MAEKRNMATECLAAPPQQDATQQPQPQSFQQQPLMQPQQPLVIQMRRPAPKRYDKFRRALSRKLGIAQIVCGVLAVILHGVRIGMQEYVDIVMFAAFWCPVFVNGVMTRPTGHNNPSGAMAQSTGKILEPVEPTTSEQLGDPAVLQPSNYGKILLSENQPRSQTGKESPPPPYQ